MKLSESLKSLATLSGIKEDDANLVKLLAATNTIDVDDTLAATLGTSLLTMDAAKNNPTLKSHFTGQALSTLDSKIDAQLVKFGLSEEEIAEIKGIKSSYERVEKLTELVAKNTESKSGNNKTVSEKAQAKLETEKAELIKQLGLKETEYKDSLTGFKKDFMLNNLLAGMQYTLPDELGASEKTAMVKSILTSKMNELGVVFDLDNDKLIPKTKENTIYYKNNQPISTEDFVKQILTEKKLVKVADASKNTQRQQPIRRDVNPDDRQVKVVRDDTMEAELERQIQGMS